MAPAPPKLSLVLRGCQVLWGAGGQHAVLPAPTVPRHDPAVGSMPGLKANPERPTESRLPGSLPACLPALSHCLPHSTCQHSPHREQGTACGQPPPLPHSPHLSAVTPQRVPPIPNHAQQGAGSPGEGHQGGSCQAGRWSRVWAPGSFLAPTDGCPLLPARTPPFSQGGSASVLLWTPLPQPTPYACMTGASRQAGSVPCCLIASCTWLRLARGTGGGGSCPHGLAC